MQIYFAQVRRCLMSFFIYIFLIGKLHMATIAKLQTRTSSLMFEVFNAIKSLAHHHLLTLQQTYSPTPQLVSQVEVFERLVKM